MFLFGLTLTFEEARARVSILCAVRDAGRTTRDRPRASLLRRPFRVPLMRTLHPWLCRHRSESEDHRQRRTPHSDRHTRTHHIQIGIMRAWWRCDLKHTLQVLVESAISSDVIANHHPANQDALPRVQRRSISSRLRAGILFSAKAERSLIPGADAAHRSGRVFECLHRRDTARCARAG